MNDNSPMRGIVPSPANYVAFPRVSGTTAADARQRDINILSSLSVEGKDLFAAMVRAGSWLTHSEDTFRLAFFVHEWCRRDLDESFRFEGHINFLIQAAESLGFDIAAALRIRYGAARIDSIEPPDFTALFRAFGMVADE